MFSSCTGFFAGAFAEHGLGKFIFASATHNCSERISFGRENEGTTLCHFLLLLYPHRDFWNDLYEKAISLFDGILTLGTSNVLLVS